LKLGCNLCRTWVQLHRVVCLLLPPAGFLFTYFSEVPVIARFAAGLPGDFPFTGCGRFFTSVSVVATPLLSSRSAESSFFISYHPDDPGQSPVPFQQAITLAHLDAVSGACGSYRNALTGVLRPVHMVGLFLFPSFDVSRWGGKQFAPL